MKAFLLAAGLGTRLRPVTNTIPKCLVPIGGKPLMAYWFDLLWKHGITDVLVNLHYLPEKVREFVATYNTPLQISLVYEKQLLGSAGTLWQNREWVENEDAFLIAYGDNFTNANLTQMIQFHQQYQPILTMGVFKTNRPNECGIATFDENFTITSFIEKPQKPKSNWASAGLFVASPEIFQYFPTVTPEGPMDIGFHLLPQLTGKMKAYLIQDYLLDIGNLERYKQAQRDVQALTF